MSNQRIIDLPAASSGQSADLVFLYQGGVLKNCALSDLLASLAQMVPCASFDTVSLPDPANQRGRLVYCTDGNLGNPALAVSDGAAWNIVAVGDAIIAAPGAVSLGTPGPDGIPYTMPTLPWGAGSFILQKADDDGGNPNETTWMDLASNLGDGATGTDGTGSGGGSGAGAQNTRFHYRAKNTNGGLTGLASSAVTVGLPVAPDAPSLSPGANSGDIDITTPGLPDRASSFSMLRADFNGSGGNFSDFVGSPNPSSVYSNNAGSGIYCEAYVVAQNAYGTTDGAVGSGNAAE